MEVDEEVLIEAPCGAVWQALTDGRRRRRWWSYLELDAVPGGRFTERWTDEDGETVTTGGSVLEATPDRCLRLTWADRRWPADTEVEITLTRSEAEQGLIRGSPARRSRRDSAPADRCGRRR